MINEDNRELYLEYIYQWILCNNKTYQNDGIKLSVEKSDRFGRYIDFDIDNLRGVISIYNDGIIEECILNGDTSELLFYLHFQYANLSQVTSLFKDFYTALKSQKILPPTKVLLCCSGGLTTSLFADKLNQLAKLEKLNFTFSAIGFGELEETYKDYKYLFLAPQIAYLQPQVIAMVDENTVVNTIEPIIYATQNYKQLLDSVMKESKGSH